VSVTPGASGDTAPVGGPSGPGRRLVGTILLGTILNPLNSSTIAIALVTFHLDFGVRLATAQWLVSSFYLAAAVGQPLMGRIADGFGPRRVFCVGLAIVTLTAVLAPLSPGFGWLVGFRVLQGLGSSAAYPAGLAMIRARSGLPGGRIPAAALAVLTIGSSVSASLGPTLGGFFVAVAGWRAIFWINLPLTLAGLALGLLWLPRDPAMGGGGLAAIKEFLGRVDLPGILLFSASLTGLLAFLLTLSERPLWPLLAVAPVAAGLLAWRELSVAHPFLDLRMLGAHPALVGVYAQFAAVNLVFYSFFFGLPIWLEEVRGLGPDAAGLLLLPVTGLGVILTPPAARLAARAGARIPVSIGAAAMTAGSLLLFTLAPTSPLWGVLAVTCVFGIPNAFNNMGLQAALYQAAPAAAMGAASGQYQTFRYVGAILSTSLVGLAFNAGASSASLHRIALVLTVVAALLVVVSLTTRRAANPVRG
jgi:MFS family permease